MTLLWQAVSWGLTIASARYLMPGDYGVIALAETFAPYLSYLATLSVGNWLIQATTLDRDDVHAATLFSVCLSSAVSIFAFLACPFAARFYGDESLILPFRLISLVFFLRGLLAVPNAVLQRELRFKELSVLALVVVVIRGVLQLVFAMNGFGFWSLILGMLIAEVATCAANLSMGRSALRFRFKRETWRRIARFGIPATLSTFCWILFSSADNIIVGKLFGTEMLGIYAMAYYLSNLPMSKINGMFKQVAYSYLSRLNNDGPAFRKACLEINRIFCLLIFPFLFGMGLVSERGIPLLFGEKWRALCYPLSVLSFSAVFRVIIDSLPTLLTASGNALLAFHVQLLGAAVLPASFFVGAKIFGMAGIYGTWLLVFPIAMVFMIRLGKPGLGISVFEYLWNLRAPTVCTAVMTIAVAGLQRTITLHLGAVPAIVLDVSTGVLTYGVMLFVVFREEGRSFLRFFRQRRKSSAGSSGPESAASLDSRAAAHVSPKEPS